MIRRAVQTMMTMAALSLTACALETPDTGKLLEQLHSDDFDLRVKAQTELIARGNSAREKIDAELERKDLDPDYRDTLRAIRAKLKNDEVLKEFDNPKRVDLVLKDQPVPIALDWLNKEFGVHLKMQEESQRKVSLDLKQVTLAEALERIRAAGNLAYQVDQVDPNEFALRELAAGAPFPVAATGPLLVVVTDLALERRLSFTDETLKPGTAQRQLSLSGTVLLQPGTRVGGIDLVGLHLKPKTGDEMPFNESSVSNESLEEGGWSRWILSATLEGAQEIAGPVTLGGTLKVSVPIRTSETALADLSEKVNKPQDVMGGAFTILKVENQMPLWHLQFKVDQALANSAVGRAMGWSSAQEALPIGEAGNSMIVLNAAGKPIAQSQTSNDAVDGAMTITLQLDEKPEKIVFRKVLETATREFKFEILNVPMP